MHAILLCVLILTTVLFLHYLFRAKMYKAMEELARQVRPRNEIVPRIALALLQTDAVPCGLDTAIS